MSFFWTKNRAEKNFLLQSKISMIITPKVKFYHLKWAKHNQMLLLNLTHNFNKLEFFIVLKICKKITSLQEIGNTLFNFSNFWHTFEMNP